MKRRDILIILLAILAAGGLYLIAHGQQARGIGFVVTVDGEERLRASLSKDDVYTIEQEDGSVNAFEVKDGAVYMIEANCRDGLCIRQGRTNSPAKSIVCLPHNLVISVTMDEATVQASPELDVIIQ